MATTLSFETFIHAPIEFCFDAARDIDLHSLASAHTSEKAVAGKTHGLIGLHETVTFEAVHFGIRQRLTAQITEFERPHYFVDEMVRGAFKKLWHKHSFHEVQNGTLMKDLMIWTSPFGIVGKIADQFLIKPHIKNYMRVKNNHLKRIIEEKWVLQAGKKS